jgi:hypothetical protein
MPSVRFVDGAVYDSSIGISYTNLPQIEALICCLDDWYQFRDRPEVKAFLKRHCFLITVLLNALAQIKSRFGQETQIALEVVHDPEDGDSKLFAFVLTSLSVSEALTMRDRMDEEWWLEASEGAKGQLILDVELI